MRVAYYSPLPPSRSGIADYSALLLPALRERMDVVVARPGRFRRAPKADVHLYHVGNDPVEHGWIVEALERRPGVVVLHEFVLHHLVSGITLARGDVEGYCAALEREAGPEGRDLGLAVQQGRIEPLWETRAQDSRSRGSARRRHRPDRPLAATSRASPATPATSACPASADACLAGAADRPGADRRRARSSAASGTSTRASASRSCSRRSCGLDRTRGCCWSAPGRRACLGSSCPRP